MAGGPGCFLFLKQDKKRHFMNRGRRREKQSGDYRQEDRNPRGELEGYILVREGIIAELSRGARPQTSPASGWRRGRVRASRLYRPAPARLWGLEVGADAGDLLQIARELARRGITAFLPTLVPLPLEQMAAVVEAVDRAMEEQSRAREEGRPAGAEILGIHLEGPFLNPAKKGVLRSEYFLLPSESAMEALRWGGSGKVRRITLAPELPGALELIRRLREKGFLVTGGHTALVKSQPASAEAYNNLGVALLMDGALEEAQAAFEQAIALDHENLLARKHLALICLQTGDYTRAAQILDALLLELPDEVELRLWLGQCYTKLGNPQAARRLYTEILRTYPITLRPKMPCAHWTKRQHPRPPPPKSPNHCHLSQNKFSSAEVARSPISVCTCPRAG